VPFTERERERERREREGGREERKEREGEREERTRHRRRESSLTVIFGSRRMTRTLAVAVAAAGAIRVCFKQSWEKCF